MPDPTPAPAPAPTPAPSKTNVLVHDARVILGAVVTAGEAILVTLPSGPVHDAFAIGLPIVSAVAMALVNLGG